MSLHPPCHCRDSALILRFIIDLCIYEERHGVKTICRHPDQLVWAQRRARVNLRRLDGVPIGYAVYFFLYSTWLEHGIIWKTHQP
jgi:hypothetical protein